MLKGAGPGRRRGGQDVDGWGDLQTMICLFCKADNLAGMKFCARCGLALPTSPDALPPQPKLVWRASDGSTQEQLLVLPSVSIGRVAGNEVILADSSVSRQHARINRSQSGRYTIVDLDSLNGTFVNGSQVLEEREIHDGDVITVGRVELRVSLPYGPPHRPTSRLKEESTVQIRRGDGVSVAAPALTGSVPEEPSIVISLAPEAMEEVVPPPDHGDGSPMPPSNEEPAPSSDDEDTLVGPVPEAVPAPRPAARLVLPDGSSLDLPECTTIGRDQNNDVALRDDRQVSRHHARITRRQGRSIIEDLGSANGTWVNQEKLSAPRELRDGDVIRVGRSLLQFREPAGSSPPPEPGDRAMGRVIAFFSLKGGVGTTSLAVNMAIMLRRLTGDSVALIDLGAERGSVRGQLDLDHGPSLADLAGRDLSSLDADAVRALVSPHASGIAVLPAPPASPRAEQVTPDVITAVIRVLRQTYGWIVADTPSTFSEANLRLFDQTDVVIIVTASDMLSLRATQAALDILSLLKVPGDGRSLVLNHPAPIRMVTRDEVEKFLGERVDAVIPYGGEEFVRAACSGSPLALTAPHHPSVLALEDVARRLVGVPSAGPLHHPPTGWIARIKGLLG